MVVTLLFFAVGVAVGLFVMGLVPNLIGIIAGVAVAFLICFGGTALLSPERRVGRVRVSDLQNGEHVADALDRADRFARDVAGMADRVGDSTVRDEMHQLVGCVRRLADRVRDRPGAVSGLDHFLDTYEEQCRRALAGYEAVMRSGSSAQVREATEDIIEALNALEGAADGEAARSTSVDASGVEDASEAIRRLTAMDGYVPDGAAAPDGATAPGARSASGEE